MLTQKATPERIAEWKVVYAQYGARLSPNRKPAAEIVAYLKSHYPVTEVTDEKWKKVVTGNVLANEGHAQKLPAGQRPEAIVFSVLNEGTGKRLHEEREASYQGVPIVAGIELETGFFLVEGSPALWDELFSFRGLDADDLKNFYLVAEYVACLKERGRLNEALS